ncbi:unknown [Prevotella sp. CAG:279]|nr:unknown [Prevotella sp. CAG:279]
MIVLMTCLDVVMIVAELCRKRHNKVTEKMLKTPLEYVVCFFVCLKFAVP